MKNSIDLSNLPIWKKGESNVKEGKTNWKKSIGYKVKFIYDNIEGEVEIIDYDGKYLSIKYLDKEPFKIFTGSFQKCMLGKLLEKKINEFKIEVDTVFKDDKRNITIIDRECREKLTKNGYINNERYYKYKCLKCGYEGWIIEGNLLNKRGCSCCGIASKIVVEGINDIPTTAPWMIKFFQGGYNEAKLYTRSCGQSIYPICPDCGRIKDKEIRINQIYNKKSIGCLCGDGISYPEKIMFNILKQLDTNSEYQYNPEWIKPKKYDFYFELNNNKYIIEMDGEFHSKDNSMSGQTKEESKAIDDYKDRLAKEHNIEVIRIDSEKSDLNYIKNNILDKLNDLFDLSNIDWNQAEEFALSNRVLEACKLKRDNPKFTTNDIGKIMKLSYFAITTYLKKGTKLGWCDYNPKEESRKSGYTNSKPVEIFKDSISLGKFKSCCDLERQSEELFGTKLDHSLISRTCRDENKTYKGFILKYIN